MSRRKNKRIDITKQAAEFNANPFIDLKLDLPRELPENKPKKPEPETEPEPKTKLGPEDLLLLKHFDTGDITVASPEKRPSKRRLSMGIQRKGKGGKTVTRIGNFLTESEDERMQLLAKIRSDLGTGGAFVDDWLELQGDQRERARKWFLERGIELTG